MGSERATGITALLNAANAGDASAQEEAYALVYDELKRCALKVRHVVPGSSLTPTALVNELYLRLNEHPVAQIHSRAHFFALAARAMRQIVVDHARRRSSQKRGGGVEVTDIDDANLLGDRGAEEALDLDAALTRLELRDAELARVVKWHFFAGLSFKEIGAALSRHERTVFHDWELARSWLQQAMCGQSPA